MPRSRANTSALKPRITGLLDVSSTVYAENQVLKALGTLKKFSSEDEIAREASLSASRVQSAIDWLAANRFLELSVQSTAVLWRLSDEGLDLLKGIDSTGAPQ